MDSIGQLFDKFAVAYQHSLYAIEQEENKANKKREEQREIIRKQFAREKSKSATSSVNNLMTTLHKLNEVSREINQEDNTVINVAEYLNYGKLCVENIKKMIFSDTSVPCIIPFIGEKNIMLKSKGNECHTIGLQFALETLLQTAPGQIAVTVINPELRPEFSAFTRIPDFQMLTNINDISDFFFGITQELVQVDSLLQGRYDSLVELRQAAQQPVGRLQLIVIQDLPKSNDREFKESLIRIFNNGPRAGIGILLLSKTKSFVDTEFTNLTQFNVFKFEGDSWYSDAFGRKKVSCQFPVKSAEDISKSVSKLIEDTKKSSVITIPFKQIERMNQMWTEDSTDNIVFNLGKSGLDTISVCIGDKVSQHHNILISGAVGKGKSNLLEVMVHSLCWRYSPNELELYLLDFKDGLTFKPYANRNTKSWLPHARMLGLESDRDVGLAVLKDLEKERLHRAELFRNAPDGGAKGYESYRKKFPNKIIPRIMLVIDEYQKLFETNDDISEEASALLENLVRQGRACAIHVVLASQSINGAAGLLGKDERIYAQFPVRIALQNTISESYALFGIGNDVAAQLRVRGEAVINENYGAVDSNRKFTVAFAEPKETEKLRQLFCDEFENKYPEIFTRQDYMNFSMIMPEVKKWRKSAENSGIVHIPIGIKLSVNRDVISIPFTNDIGKNIAIIGSAENLHGEGIIPGQHNMAVGMIQGMGVSLALQHPEGNGRFVLVNGLGQDIYANSNISRWLQLMERFGYPVEQVDSTEAIDWLSGFKQEIGDSALEEDTYIFCLGMDRYSNFTEINLCGESGADTFQQLLKYGTQGVHFICWWANESTYKTHLGFGNDGYFETKILLRMDTDTSRDVLGPFISWSVRENRAYVHDNSELPSDEVVLPLMPMNNRMCGIIESEGWSFE